MHHLNLILCGVLSLSFGCYSQQFSEQAIASGINHKHIDINQIGGGIAIFDLNGDGFEDLYLTGGSSDDKLFLNDQDGTFTDISSSSGIATLSLVHTVGVTTGDIDNDGDRDIFVTTFRDDNNRLLLNNGDATFTDISISAGITETLWSSAATMGDYNNDGYLDIYVANYTNYLTEPFFLSMNGGIDNSLYLNNGDLTFTNVSAISGTDNGGTSLAVAFTNFDQDEDVDLLLGNDFGYNYGANALYQNNHPFGDFTNVGTSIFMDYEIDAMGIAIGDFDEDLDFDYYISNMMENLLHVRDPALTFSESALAAQVQVDSLVSWGTFFFDYENDTYLDLFVANGGVMAVATPQPNTLFKNMQNGTFQDLSITEGVDSIKRSRGAAYGDFNNDGYLDIVVANVGQNAGTTSGTSLYLSTPTSNHWVAFELQGNSVNRDAFGAHVTLYSNGRSWIREIGGGSSYLSQNSSRAYFGLGTFITIDSVKVDWPGPHSEIFTGILIDQINPLVQGAVGIDETSFSPTFSISPNPTKDLITLRQDKEQSMALEILNQNGQVLRTMTFMKQEVTLDLSALSSGVYFIRATTSTSTSVQKIVKR